MRRADQGVERRRDARMIVAGMAALLGVLGVAIVVVALNGFGGGRPAPGEPDASPTSSDTAAAHSPGSSLTTASPSAQLTISPAAGQSASPTDGAPSASTTAGPPSSAAPPGTDGGRVGLDVTDPVVVERLPFTFTADSRGAAAPPWDPSWDCLDSGESGHAMWFSYRAPEETFVGAWVSAADSYTELWAFEYDPSDGSLRFVDCSVGPFDRALRFLANAGATYRIMVTDYEHQGWGGRGGEFTINFEVPPRLPEVSLSIDPSGVAIREIGAANFSGTIHCSPAVELAAFYVHLRQSDDAQGSEAYDMRCARRERPWYVEVPADDPGYPFTAGPATASVTATVCLPDDYDGDGPWYCDDVVYDGTVTLEPAESEPPHSTDSPQSPSSAPATEPPASEPPSTPPVPPASP